MVAKNELKNRRSFVNFIFAHAKVLSPQKLPIHFLQLQVISPVMSDTNLRAALARLPHSPSCGVFFVLDGWEHWVWWKRMSFRGGNFKVSA